jgi:hypothetical protein
VLNALFTVLNTCKDAIPSLLINKYKCEVIEKLTRQQRESKYWSTYRVGRISGLTLKQAISVDVEKPTYSLIKNICYPAASGLKLLIYFVLDLFFMWFYKLSILTFEFLNRRNLKKNPPWCHRP